MYPPGDFSFVSGVARVMLTDAYQAVSSTESWEIMKNDPGGFMFSRGPYEAIDNAMKYTGHSGATYALTMRVMQRIAILGWELYILEESRAL